MKAQYRRSITKNENSRVLNACCAATGGYDPGVATPLQRIWSAASRGGAELLRAGMACMLRRLMAQGQWHVSNETRRLLEHQTTHAQPPTHNDTAHFEYQKSTDVRGLVGCRRDGAAEQCELVKRFDVDGCRDGSSRPRSKLRGAALIREGGQPACAGAAEWHERGRE